MKLFLLALVVLGVVLITWGVAIASGTGSADERVAAAIPVMSGVGFIALAVVVAFAWVVIRA